MSKTFDSSLWSRYFGDRWKAVFFCPGCLSGKREQEGTGRMQTFHCGRNVSGDWCQEEARLSISQQAEICRTSLKVTSALKALKLKQRIVILSLLTQMVSMIQPSPQCPLWLRYKGNDGMGILTRLDKPTPQLTKSAMGVQLLFALAFLCECGFPSLFLSKHTSSISCLLRLFTHLQFCYNHFSYKPNNKPLH